MKRSGCWAANYCALAHASPLIYAKGPCPIRCLILIQTGGATQEADESQLWLELLRDDCAIRNPALNALLNETEELIAIFVTMVNQTKGKS